MSEKSEPIKVNDLIYYQKKDDEMLHITLTDVSVNILAKYGLLVTGVKALARITDEDKSIKGLIVVSDQVKLYANQLDSMFHFTVDGPVDEKKEIWKAHIDRATLIDYFLPQTSR